MVAPPGSGKSEILMSLRASRSAQLVSKLTPQTLVSGWQANKPSQKSSLLKRIPDRAVLILKDFTTVLKMRSEDRAQILSQLREVYDGAIDASYGTGADVRWRGKIGILAGVTDLIDNFAPYEQMLGERFLKIRLAPGPRGETARKALRNASHEQKMKQALKSAVGEFLSTPRRRPADITMSKGREDQIIALADLIARARSSPHRNPYSREIDSVSEPEGPSRLARQFGLLARSLASARGHDHVQQADIETTYRVGTDSLTASRRRVLASVERLSGNDAGVSVPDVSAALDLGRSTTERHLEDIGHAGGGLISKSSSDKWTLSPVARDLIRILKQSHP